MNRAEMTKELCLCMKEQVPEEIRIKNFFVNIRFIKEIIEQEEW